jgi:CheY-like chemotaxis protein
MEARSGPVLVVDDDADIREALSLTLGDEGFSSVEVTDGKAALDYLRANPLPPLILLDWNMAPVNGSAFMAEVAKDAALAAIPVVLLTADLRAQEKAKTSHFIGYLKKPVDLDKLFDFVRRYCQPNSR